MIYKRQIPNNKDRRGLKKSMKNMNHEILMIKNKSHCMLVIYKIDPKAKDFLRYRLILNNKLFNLPVRYKNSKCVCTK